MENKRKRSNINNIIKSYKTYKTNSSRPLDKNTYVEICNNFMLFLSNRLIEKGHIKFPRGLGDLIISGRKIKPTIGEDGKIKGLSPDWKATKELWEQDAEAKEKKLLVFHTNDNTNNIRYKNTWIRARSPVTNKMIYNFILTRANKRALAKKIKEGNEYLIVEKNTNKCSLLA